MHCTLNRTQSDISAISDRRKASLPLKHLEHHNDTTLEVVVCALISPIVASYNSLVRQREIHYFIKLFVDFIHDNSSYFLQDCIEPPVIFPNIHDRYVSCCFLGDANIYYISIGYGGSLWSRNSRKKRK